MLTREQEHAVDTLTLQTGRLAIKEGFEDGAVHLTKPDGSAFILDRWGALSPAGADFSVRWDR